MKLDEKYFVPFLAVMAIIVALMIVFFTINSQQGKEQAFRNKMAAQDSLKSVYMPVIDGADSLRVLSYPNAYVIVDFWATWTSTFSERAHKQLVLLKNSYSNRVEVLAAVVEDKTQNVEDYIDRYRYPFHFVDGTQVFNRFDVPGVPTQLVYAPGGELQSIFTGYADSTRLDSLRTMIGNER